MKAQVAIVSVKNNDVDAAVRQAVDLLGGIAQFVEQTQEVLLKPNLLSAPPDPAKREKIRTDPRVVEAITKMVRECKKQVLIGDSSGMGVLTRDAIKNSGYLEIQEKNQGVTVRSFEQRGPEITSINGKKLQTANIAKDVLEAEAIINIPKMKTHGLTVYTGAIKNLFGTICGHDKTRIHAEGVTLDAFSQCLVDIFAFERDKVVLHVMDAVIALEGLGPGVKGKKVQMNLVLASTDAVALDAVAITLMGHKAKRVPTTRLAAKQQLGTMALEEIEILGEAIADHKRKFSLPKSVIFSRIIPFWWKFSVIAKQVPNYTGGCTGCRTCVKACPTKVITLKRTKEGQHEPVINYKGCISCFTCAEVCPEACYAEKLKYKNRLLLISGLILVALVATIIPLVVFLR